MFGGSVSISGDGTRIAVGAYGNDGHSNWTGKLYSYELVGGTWNQIGSTIRGDTGTDASLGSSVVLSEDGKVMAAYAPRRSNGGRTFIYEYNENEWALLGNYIEDENSTYRNRSLSLSSDGRVIAIGRPISINTGTEIYQYADNQWSQLGTFDSSIGSVYLSGDGGRLSFNSESGQSNPPKRFRY